VFIEEVIGLAILRHISRDRVRGRDRFAALSASHAVKQQARLAQTD